MSTVLDPPKQKPGPPKSRPEERPDRENDYRHVCHYLGSHGRPLCGAADYHGVREDEAIDRPDGRCGECLYIRCPRCLEFTP